MDKIFKRPFRGRSYIGAPAELSIPFLLDEKSTVATGRQWVEITLRDELSVRDARWSEAVAVGNLNFVEKMKSKKRGR